MNLIHTSVVGSDTSELYSVLAGYPRPSEATRVAGKSQRKKSVKVRGPRIEKVTATAWSRTVDDLVMPSLSKVQELFIQRDSQSMVRCTKF